MTSFNLMGDAWAWWQAADHVYARGSQPAPGAVMVFSRTAQMHVGHVAIVRAQIGPREIIIDHANWHRGRIERGMHVLDASPNNDWSAVKVQWEGQIFGGPTPVTGFIYPAQSDRPDRQPVLLQAAYHPGQGHSGQGHSGQGHLVLASLHRPDGHHRAVSARLVTASFAPKPLHVSSRHAGNSPGKPHAAVHLAASRSPASAVAKPGHGAAKPIKHVK